MKGFWRYFKGWMDDPYNAFVVGGLIVVILYYLYMMLKKYYPSMIWVNILGSFAQLLIFFGIAFAGFLAIRHKYLPVFIIPIEGIPAMVIGFFLLGIGGVLIIQFVSYEITLISSLIN